MNDFSFKELEHCYLKATYPVEVGTRKIEPGEPIAVFDSIQLAGLQEFKSVVSANGGFDNRPHVFWEQTKEINLNFSQGVFSKTQFSLMSNSKLFEKGKNEDFLITETERLETNEGGSFELKNVPVDLFVYDENGVKLPILERDGNRITTEGIFKNVVVTYTYKYDDNVTVVKIGSPLLKQFVSFEGRTRVKDDTTGQVVSGIIKIPKLKLTTNLSIQLGARATPIVGSFRGVGCPVGSRGNSYVSEFCFLNNDLDSDF